MLFVESDISLKQADLNHVISYRSICHVHNAHFHVILDIYRIELARFARFAVREYLEDRLVAQNDVREFFTRDHVLVF